MTIWWKLVVILAVLAFQDALLWRVFTWREGSKANEVLKVETTATKEAMKKSSEIDTSFSDSTAHLQQLENSAKQQLEAIHETPSAPCVIDPVRLHILDTAIAASPPAR
jgi:hypothetical protein